MDINQLIVQSDDTLFHTLGEMFKKHGVKVDSELLRSARTGEGRLLTFPFYRELYACQLKGRIAILGSHKPVNEILRMIIDTHGELVMDCATFVQLCSLRYSTNYLITLPPRPSFNNNTPIAYIGLSNLADRNLLVSTTATCKGQWVIDYSESDDDCTQLLGLTDQGPMLCDLASWITHLRRELLLFAAKHQHNEGDADHRNTAAIIFNLSREGKLLTWSLEYHME